MSDFNSLTLIGRLTRDPVARRTSSGTAVTDFRLAVSDGGPSVPTCFIDVAVWNLQAERCAEHLTQGRRVLVDGRLCLREWEDSNGGKHSRHSVTARRVLFLDPPRGARRRDPEDPLPDPPTAGEPEPSPGESG